MDARVGKKGANAGELQGETQKRARQGSSVQIVITPFALFLFEIYGDVGLPRADELRSQDAHQRLPFAPYARLELVEEPIGIPLLDLLVEIDVPREDIGELGQKGGVQPGLKTIPRKRFLDGASRRFKFNVVRPFPPVEGDPLPPPLPREDPILSQFHLQGLETLPPLLSPQRGIRPVKVKVQLLPCRQPFSRVMPFNRTKPQLLLPFG